MAQLERSADDLLAQPWSSVHIGDSPFLLKAAFGDAVYRLMLSDLNSVWWEEVNSDELKQRAQELNKRLRAPVSAFCRHLSGLLEPLLQTGGSKVLPGFTCERTCNLLTISLRSELSGVPFYWAFRCTEAPLSMVSRHMICPLLNMMQALHRQTRDLMLLLQRKDAEILDYKESGAMLSRDRLATDIFDAEEFKERFLAESLSEAINMHDGRMFDSELQHLYTTIIAVKTSRKRRHSSGNQDSGNPQPSLQEAQDVAVSETKSEEITPKAAESPEIKKQPSHDRAQNRISVSGI
ncbi:non-homologous end-joining factor 1 isoform X2 [Pristis pectinata]|uniref:non-homologous end-joining factor 1 isoform X2 n=1 Tax=Pristis pectinata TaxID=685728 RepID=UPI00223D7B3D|nr:non-homologous end-joining factor 1 isoform X2 [Pristis pectinata]